MYNFLPKNIKGLLKGGDAEKSEIEYDGFPVAGYNGKRKSSNYETYKGYKLVQYKANEIDIVNDKNESIEVVKSNERAKEFIDKKGKKSEPKGFDENSKSHKLKGSIILEKTSENMWMVSKSKGESKDTATITKENGKYNVILTHQTKGFDTFEEAVKHLEYELYEGVLADFIDEKKNKAEARKKYKELNFVEAISKDADSIEDKADKMEKAGKKVTKPQAKVLTTKLKIIAKSVIKVMTKEERISLAKKQIKFWQTFSK